MKSGAFPNMFGNTYTKILSDKEATLVTSSYFYSQQKMLY